MKEPNAIKLFVGQIPRDWTEKELTEIFEPFGEIFRINLLQDQVSGHHKGCAFLTYYENESAKRAQAEVHESRTLPGARHPIQVKPAASETNVEDRTLYVGMLSKKLDENAVREMFSPFGTIENLHTLKNPDGKPKGCAFIKYETRLQAQNAIKAMHNSETMEGCTYPLVVRIADTEKDKMAKKGIAQVGSSIMPTAGYPSVAAIPAAAYGVSPIQATAAYYQQLLAQQMALPQLVAGSPAVVAASPYHTLATSKMGFQPQYQVISQPLQSSHKATIPQSSGSYLTTAGGMGNVQMLSVGGGIVAYPTVGTSSLANGSTAFGDATLQQAYSGMQQYVTALPQAYLAPQTSGQQQRQISSSKRDGSDGTNLFIYHLPSDFKDADLLQTFSPFGSVVSAKVYIDKTTGLSKCFGFVSYTSASSANAAIKAMNGAAVGSKRLKVQLKRPKDQDKPY